MMIGLGVLLLLATVGGAFAGESCEPQDCIKVVTARTNVALAEVPQGALVGVWMKGSGLAGSVLYLLADQSYIYSEWADVQAETIVDKGRWQVDRGVLLMARDADVVWTRETDRRYLLLSSPQHPIALLGIDVALWQFRAIADGHPEIADAGQWLQAASFKRSKGLGAKESQALKARLLQSSWRPEYFLGNP
jgi:hypothetical protein